ncbi:hypothetical protein PsorP6_001156 [Peronosclerospora sorghi]|uniref:Uncharacterized protein n=1 Tax=Peronosclerospora sorghi TaxID=230839 RepID=A0ACC0WV33_9STRA|nr:hypothetical protein PsorP6_001156 [Peronosclerospora sorghi]
MVARALECPIALIGIMEDASFRIKASCGLDTRVTSIPRNECVCVHTLTQNMTTVVDDTRLDQYFQAKVYDAGRKSMRYYAGTPVCIGNHGVGVLCALDTKSHTRTTNEMKLILEAVADIVAEVLEQRLASGGTMKPPMEMKDSIGVAFQRGMISQNASLHSLDLLFVSQRKLFSSDEATSYDSRHSSMSSYLSQQDADKIAQVMVFFKQLQRSMWCEQRIGSKRSCNGAIRLFELVYDAKVFTRSIMKMAGSCSTVIAELLNYETSSLYPEFFTRASSRYDLDDATFLDIVSVHTSINSTSARILTHQRKYPDGSNVVVAMKGDNDTPETNESGFLFGWYVAPSRQDGDVTSLVKVSCITAEVHHDASRGQNLSLDLLRRMYRKMSMARVVVQSNETETFSVDPSEEPSSAQTESLISEKNKTLLRSSNKMHLETQSIDPTETSRETNHMTRGTLHDTVAQVSQVNEMEQLLMAFLDKTIGTQALLVQQHHEMVSIMDVHGNQLQRISSALRRMESILSATERRRAC